MLRRFLALALVFGTLAGAGAARADERWETLRAINWVENPTNHTRTGRFGELGPYQFRPATWRMHTKKSFRLAVQRDTADEVAVLHYEWIKRGLENAGVDATPFNIALAWNSGVTNVVRGTVPDSTYNYAQRVTNLVSTFHDRSVASTAAPIPDAQVSTAPVSSRPFAPTLDDPVVFVTSHPDAPHFEIANTVVTAANDPIVYTSKAPASERPTFSVPTTTATLVPRFNLFPGLGE